MEKLMQNQRNTAAPSESFVGVAALAEIRKKGLPPEAFIADLAADRDLLMEGDSAQKRLKNRNQAPVDADDDTRFGLDQAVWRHSKRLSEFGRSEDIQPACICAMGKRQILLLASKRVDGCRIGDVF